MVLIEQEGIGASVYLRFGWEGREPGCSSSPSRTAARQAPSGGQRCRPLWGLGPHARFREHLLRAPCASGEQSPCGWPRSPLELFLFVAGMGPSGGVYPISCPA